MTQSRPAYSSFIKTLRIFARSGADRLCILAARRPRHGLYRPAGGLRAYPRSIAARSGRRACQGATARRQRLDLGTTGGGRPALTCAQCRRADEPRFGDEAGDHLCGAGRSARPTPGAPALPPTARPATACSRATSTSSAAATRCLATTVSGGCCASCGTSGSARSAATSSSTAAPGACRPSILAPSTASRCALQRRRRCAAAQLQRPATHPGACRRGRRTALTSDPPIAGLVVDNALRTERGPCGDWDDRLDAELTPDGATNRLVVRGAWRDSCGRRDWHVVPLNATAYDAGLIEALWRELGGKLGRPGYRRRRAERHGHPARRGLAAAWRRGSRHEQVVQQRAGPPSARHHRCGRRRHTRCGERRHADRQTSPCDHGRRRGQWRSRTARAFRASSASAHTARTVARGGVAATVDAGVHLLDGNGRSRRNRTQTPCATARREALRTSRPAPSMAPARWRVTSSTATAGAMSCHAGEPPERVGEPQRPGRTARMGLGGQQHRVLRHDAHPGTIAGHSARPRWGGLIIAARRTRVRWLDGLAWRVAE